LIKFTIILLYLILIFLISIVFKKFNEDSKEIVRKIIHIGIGPLIPIAQFLKIDRHECLSIVILTSTFLIEIIFVKKGDFFLAKNNLSIT